MFDVDYGGRRHYNPQDAGKHQNSVGSNQGGRFSTRLFAGGQRIAGIYGLLPACRAIPRKPEDPESWKWGIGSSARR